MKIMFHCPEINERGTTRATLDYALFNETHLNNRSVILTRENQVDGAFHEYSGMRFPVLTYRRPEDIEDLEVDADAFYVLTHGDRERVPIYLPSGCRTLVHCVFRARTPCGDVYAVISDHVNHRSGTDHPVVPHMIHLPEVSGNLRDELGIPENATVIGRHGGMETFDLRFVHRAVERALRMREDLYFLFMNTRPFLPPHERVIHLPVGGAEAGFPVHRDLRRHAPLPERGRDLRPGRGRVLLPEPTRLHLVSTHRHGSHRAIVPQTDPRHRSGGGSGSA